MECIEAILSRRSIRKFTDDNVESGDLNTILEAGRMAPTAGNLQPCYFIVVKDPARKKALREAALDQEVITQADAVIVVCADPDLSSKYGEKGRNHYCLLDCANTTQNMLLAAHSLGYGACWVGGFSERAVKKLMGVPDHFRIVSLIPIGHPAEMPTPPDRRPLQDMVRQEKW